MSTAGKVMFGVAPRPWQLPLVKAQAPRMAAAEVRLFDQRREVRAQSPNHGERANPRAFAAGAAVAAVSGRAGSRLWPAVAVAAVAGTP